MVTFFYHGQEYYEDLTLSFNFFSNLDCLDYLGFLRMFLLLIVDFFFSKFFKGSMFIFSQPRGHQIEFVSTIFYNIYILLIKILVCSM